MPGPIITGEITDSTIEPWMLWLTIAALVLLFLFAIIYWGLSRLKDGGLTLGGSYILPVSDSQERRKITRLQLTSNIAVIAMTVLLIGGASMLIYNRGHDDREVHEDRLISTIEDQYAINSVSHTSSKLLSYGFDTIDISLLCAPLTPQSPEFTGIAEGQSIAFIVSVDDCRSNDPTINIAITKTPLDGIRPENLLKDTVSKER